MEPEEEKPEPPRADEPKEDGAPEPEPEPELSEEEQREAALAHVCEEGGVDDAELAKLRGTFSKFDADGSGAIDATELMVLLEDMGGDYSPEEVMLVLDAVDTDDSGVIDFVEFVHWWAGGKDDGGEVSALIKEKQEEAAQRKREEAEARKRKARQAELERQAAEEAEREAEEAAADGGGSGGDDDDDDDDDDDSGDDVPPKGSPQLEHRIAKWKRKLEKAKKKGQKQKIKHLKKKLKTVGAL